MAPTDGLCGRHLGLQSTAHAFKGVLDRLRTYSSVIFFMSGLHVPQGSGITYVWGTYESIINPK